MGGGGGSRAHRLSVPGGHRPGRAVDAPAEVSPENSAVPVSPAAAITVQAAMLSLVGGRASWLVGCDPARSARQADRPGVFLGQGSSLGLCQVSRGLGEPAQVDAVLDVLVDGAWVRACKDQWHCRGVPPAAAEADPPGRRVGEPDLLVAAAGAGYRAVERQAPPLPGSRQGYRRCSSSLDAMAWEAAGTMLTPEVWSRPRPWTWPGPPARCPVLPDHEGGRLLEPGCTSQDFIRVTEGLGEGAVRAWQAMAAAATTLRESTPAAMACGAIGMRR